MRRALSHTHRLIHKKLLLGSPYLRLHAAAPSTILCRQETTTTPRRSLTSSRPDPFARRPNKVCDPYGQGGKPLSVEDAEKLLTTVSEEWWLGEESSVHSISRDFEHADLKTGCSGI